MVFLIPRWIALLVLVFRVLRWVLRQVAEIIVLIVWAAAALLIGVYRLARAAVSEDRDGGPHLPPPRDWVADTIQAIRNLPETHRTPSR